MNLDRFPSCDTLIADGMEKHERDQADLIEKEMEQVAHREQTRLDNERKKN